MTRPSDALRAGLHAIAGRAQPVDLYERSLARSRQIGRRRAVMSASAAAVAIVLIAVGTWRLTPRSDSAPLPPASPSAMPSTSPNPSPTAGPTVTASVPSSVAPVPPVDLANETLDVPAWPKSGGVGPCPTRIVLTNGKMGDPQTSVEVSVVKTVAVDVNADGVTETVALLNCFGPSEGSVQQVVAYRGRSGSLTVVGQVAGKIPDLGTQLSRIEDIAADGASVRVEVANGPQGSAPPTYYRVHQWRTFGWNGAAFTQIAGSTSFLADPAVAKLSVTPTPLVVPAGTGCGIATMTLRIRNDGPQTAAGVTAALLHPDVDPGDCPNVPPNQGWHSTLVDVGTVAPGTTKDITVTIVYSGGGSAGITSDSPYNYVELRLGDQRYEPRTTYTITHG